ncbi:BING4CT-domain-containing protein [Rhodotorula sp. JG-1b]|nr:BING4CT-domain-containing protein [Rhodotorula sp. JG-1b]
MVTDRKGKGKQQLPDQRPESLLDPESGALPKHDPAYVPPAHQLKKYLYAQPHLLHAHPPTASSAPGKATKRKRSGGGGTADVKLEHHLAHLSATAKASSHHAHEHDDLLLPSDNHGLIETETALERTWRITQDEIVDASNVAARDKRFSLSLPEFGPYAIDYTRNGRHLAIAGRKGHVGTFDWANSALHSELHLNETCRDIKWLHDESFYAVAQKKYVYIYDKQGLEVHQLRSHIEVNRMEFLPYHFLLATIGNPGFLKYQDTSTGQLVAEHRTKLGSCDTMAQNAHNAFIHLGHQNGTVTLWSPSVSTAQVKLLAHSAPVSAIAVDPSTMGHRMATAGIDGSVKIWDNRMWKCLNEYGLKKPPKSLDWSQKGMLAVGWGNHVSVFNDLSRPSASPRMPPPPYLTHLFPSTQVHRVRFTPFDDTLGVGHARGFETLIVPGAGEPNYDSREADPYESKRRRREREVNSLLDKVPMDLITLDQDVLGRVDRDAIRPRAATGAAAKAQKRIEMADNKNRMRGKSSGIKKALRKRRRNVIDPQTVALKEKLERQREANKRAKANKLAQEQASSGTQSALDRFAAR